MLTVKGAPKGRKPVPELGKQQDLTKHRKARPFTSPVTGEEVFEIPDTDMKVNAGILQLPTENRLTLKQPCSR